MAVAGLERHRHPDPAFEIGLPAGAELGVMPGVLVVARAPADASGSPFRANVTVVAQELPPGTDRERLAEDSLAEAARSLPRWRLIDREPATVAGLEGERTLATYVLARGSGVDFGRALPVTVEQWRLLDAERTWIVSASCETGEYARFADLWSACAESLRPGGGTG